MAGQAGKGRNDWKDWKGRKGCAVAPRVLKGPTVDQRQETLIEDAPLCHGDINGVREITDVEGCHHESLPAMAVDARRNNVRSPLGGTAGRWLVRSRGDICYYGI